MCLGLATGYREPTENKERTYADLKHTHFPEKSGGSGDSVDPDAKGKTDEEIIKALERMSEEDPEGFSSEILKFINRKYSKIVELTEENNRQQAEITAITVKLNATIAGQETLQKHMLTVETETIKEFAESLKEQFPYSVSIRLIIDALVNERLVLNEYT